MLSSVASAILQEGEARPVRVEVDVHRGLPSFAIVVAVGHGSEAARAGGIAVYELGRLGELGAFACGELEPLTPRPADLPATRSPKEA